jgi:hypothetical protein
METTTVEESHHLIPELTRRAEAIIRSLKREPSYASQGYRPTMKEANIGLYPRLQSDKTH